MGGICGVRHREKADKSKRDRIVLSYCLIVVPFSIEIFEY